MVHFIHLFDGSLLAETKVMILRQVLARRRYSAWFGIDEQLPSPFFDTKRFAHLISDEGLFE